MNMVNPFKISYLLDLLKVLILNLILDDFLYNNALETNNTTGGTEYVKNDILYFYNDKYYFYIYSFTAYGYGLRF